MDALINRFGPRRVPVARPVMSRWPSLAFPWASRALGLSASRAAGMGTLAARHQTERNVAGAD